MNDQEKKQKLEAEDLEQKLEAEVECDDGRKEIEDPDCPEDHVYPEVFKE
jgi:hypothetical protein